MSERPYRPPKGISIDTRGQDPKILRETGDRYFLSPLCQRLKISLGETRFSQLQSLVQQSLANGRITREECNDGIKMQTVIRHARNIVSIAIDGHTMDPIFGRKS